MVTAALAAKSSTETPKKGLAGLLGRKPRIVRRAAHASAG
jgi:hypothetical protein